MFWWIVLAVVVVGFALAWWSSGRARGEVSPRTPTDLARVQGDAIRKHGTAGAGGMGGFPGGAGGFGG
ncbi:hypothetical protein [Nocardioides piscis]|uniref:Uncharacterized protein n=1 Tax=Nocardioides piscis TaxID=2714938 RepID=A0A6G7YJD4_9ACTN|nr:hypothetical protein [Nocardioides piscis]QIK76848.1 hypothetical protein G7071_16845 [Nocardioides piscis]